MNKKKGWQRRDFFKASALGLAGLGMRLPAQQAPQTKTEATEIPKIKSYRPLGRTGFRVSDIGIGTARAAVAPLVSALLDAGVNYIDTAEGYGRGNSETAIAEAIKGRDRKSFFITTKIQNRDLVNKDQVIEKVMKCLQRLQTDYVDCLMMQGTPTVASLANEPFQAAAEQLKKEKKVNFLGVANHGARMPGEGESMDQVLLGAVADGRFDLLLMVYNFLQKEAGDKILDAAAKKNIATTIMKSDPVGQVYSMKARLESMKAEGKTPDENMQRMIGEMEETLKQAQPFISENKLQNPAEIKHAAIKYVLANPLVHTLNLTFSSFDDAKNFLPLSGAGMKPAERAKLLAYASSCGRLYCRHACGACESACPQHVPVNTIMRYFHYFDAHGSEKFAMGKYASLPTAKADLCRACPGPCMAHCPHGVPIQALLTIAHQQLTLA